MRRPVLILIFAMAIFMTACGDAAEETQPTTPSTAPPATSTTLPDTSPVVTTLPPLTAPLTTVRITTTTAPPPTTTSTSSTTTTTTVPLSPPAAVATDYLTFVAGAIPLAVGGTGAQAGVDFEEAVQAVDGSARKIVLNAQPAVNPDVEFIFELPAFTTFSRFAIPKLPETPSPSQTGIKDIEILGSTQGPTSGYTLIASGALKVGDASEVNEFLVNPPVVARWIKLRLLTGQEAGATFFEFTEIIGNGTQNPVSLANIFNGIWDATFGLVELRQTGSTVAGCYDNGAGPVSGTVTGKMGTLGFYNETSGIVGAMIVTVDGAGALRGVRTDNGGPFRVYSGTPAATGVTTPCSADPVPDDPIGDALDLHCTAVLHGIDFDFDSAVIRPESTPILDQLRLALLNAPTLDVVIEGHTSSEGSDAYNLDLSRRRAQSVVDRMITLGIDSTRLSAVGKGEAEPIADNETETGRRLNRRVEVTCAA